MRKAIKDFLSSLDLHPVLVDVGASGNPPPIWESIAAHSIYVGFDPDSREIRQIKDGRYHQATIINEAVSAEPAPEKVSFYLTHSPYCSSTLEPDTEALSQYIFSHLFAVEGKVQARATTLDRVVEHLNLGHIDWLKCDTQGTDLRLYTSLREDLRNNVLALDIEPGLIDAYKGEDLFVDAHRELTRSGFWLSNLNVEGTIRGQRASFAQFFPGQQIDDRGFQYGFRRSPCWCEARYLRTVGWLEATHAAREKYILLWLFALTDGQAGFGLDVVRSYEAAFGTDQNSTAMTDNTLTVVQQTRRAATLGRLSRLQQRVVRRFRNLLSKA